MRWVLPMGVAALVSVPLLITVAVSSWWLGGQYPRITRQTLVRHRLLMRVVFVAACVASIAAFFAGMLFGLAIVGINGCAVVIARGNGKLMREANSAAGAEGEGRTRDRVEPR